MRRYVVISVAGVAALAGAFLLGRFSRPARTIETTRTETVYKTRTVYEVRRVKEIATRTRTNVVRVEVRAADGSTTTTTTDRTEIDTAARDTMAASGTSETNSARTAESSKTVDDRARWSLGASWRLYPQPTNPVPQAELGYRVLGPAWGTLHVGPSGAGRGVEVRGGVRLEF